MNENLVEIRFLFDSMLAHLYNTLRNVWWFFNFFSMFFFFFNFLWLFYLPDVSTSVGMMYRRDRLQWKDRVNTFYILLVNLYTYMFIFYLLIHTRPFGLWCESIFFLCLISDVNILYMTCDFSVFVSFVAGHRSFSLFFFCFRLGAGTADWSIHRSHRRCSDEPHFSITYLLKRITMTKQTCVYMEKK